jgi:hypothetical protein
MSGKSKLTLVKQPQEFFRALIIDALGHQKVRVIAETEFYLVNLLNEFMNTEKLYLQQSDPRQVGLTLSYRFNQRP